MRTNQGIKSRLSTFRRCSRSIVDAAKISAHIVFDQPDEPNQTEPISLGRGLPIPDGRSTEIIEKILTKAEFVIDSGILSMISLKSPDDNFWDDGQWHCERWI
jgi:hypothetical protein